MDAKQPCKEGNLIQHGGSCTSQCNAGFSATSGSLECNNGRLPLGTSKALVVDLGAAQWFASSFA